MNITTSTWYIDVSEEDLEFILRIDGYVDNITSVDKFSEDYLIYLRLRYINLITIIDNKYILTLYGENILESDIVKTYIRDKNIDMILND